MNKNYVKLIKSHSNTFNVSIYVSIEWNNGIYWSKIQREKLLNQYNNIDNYRSQRVNKYPWCKIIEDRIPYSLI